MDLFALVCLAIGLAMDATAVAIATSVGLGRVSGRQVFRFAFHFGLFQALMPVLGWFGGMRCTRLVSTWAPWVACGLLVAIGLKAVAEARKEGETGTGRSDPTRGWSLVALSVATSIDALAVGVSLAMLGVEIGRPAVVIGLVTAAMTVGGMALGRLLGARLGRRMHLLGGLVLIGLGVKILVEHTLLG